jgi:hypothetical protein
MVPSHIISSYGCKGFSSAIFSSSPTAPQGPEEAPDKLARLEGTSDEVGMLGLVDSESTRHLRLFCLDFPCAVGIQVAWKYIWVWVQIKDLSPCSVSIQLLWPIPIWWSVQVAKMSGGICGDPEPAILTKARWLGRFLTSWQEAAIVVCLKGLAIAGVPLGGAPGCLYVCFSPSRIFQDWNSAWRKRKLWGEALGCLCRACGARISKLSRHSHFPKTWPACCAACCSLVQWFDVILCLTSESSKRLHNLNPNTWRVSQGYVTTVNIFLCIEIERVHWCLF